MGASNLEKFISEQANLLLQGRRNLKLLEAGCGSASYFQFANVGHRAGIDISPEQLERNQVIQEKILGDLQTHPLPSGEFDIVVCWDVIEHLSRPREALLNMFQTLKPEGVLVLGFPNLLSFKGLATKLTPHWFHELFYRRMKYEFRPFPTYLRLAVLPNRVIEYAQANGLELVFQRLHEGGVTRRFKERFWVVRTLFATVDAIVRVLSLGNCHSLYLDNCALVFQKRISVSGLENKADPVVVASGCR
jgi:SAM-dependent methyltransferase